MTEAYPLQWPDGWPRTKYPQRSRFDTSQAEAQGRLLDELRMLGATHVVISSNVPLRRDGLPYANRRQPDDRAIAVYFILEGPQQCVPCDKWDKIKDNMQAIRLTISALRGLERWGAKEMVNAAFRGFRALPDPDRVEWYKTLGVPPGATVQEIQGAFLSLAKKHHPDRGGDSDKFIVIKEAQQEGLGQNG